MTKQTFNVISSFVKSQDIKLIPSILIGMQEEDDISNLIDFRNCFKILRNLAAHEPDTLTSQLLTGNNQGNSKLTFNTDSGLLEHRVVVDMVQFTIWMFDAYRKTKNDAYLRFWKAFIKLLYPEINNRLNRGVQKFLLDPEAYKSGLLGMFLAYQKYCYFTLGKIKTIAPEDPYVCQLYQNNIRVFWRVAVPDMMDIVLLFAEDFIDINDEANISGFIALYKEREGV